jgi:hypothetical protein
MLILPIQKIAKISSQVKRQKKNRFVPKITQKTHVSKNIFAQEFSKLAIPAEIILKGRLNYGTK